MNSIRVSRRIALAVMLALGSAAAVPTGLVTATGEPARRRSRLERQRHDRDRHGRQAAAGLGHPELRDGPGRRVRRGQRDRPRPSTVPRRAGGDRHRVEGGGRRAGGARRPRRALPGPDLDARRAADRIAERGSRWHRGGRRPGDRPGHSRGDDRSLERTTAGSAPRSPCRAPCPASGARRCPSSRATRRAGSGMSGRSSCHAATCSARMARTP